MPLSSRGFQVGAMPTSGALDPRMFLDARAVQPNVAGRTALAAFLAAKKRQMDEAQQTKENEFKDRQLGIYEQGAETDRMKLLASLPSELESTAKDLKLKRQALEDAREIGKLTDEEYQTGLAEVEQAQLTLDRLQAQNEIEDLKLAPYERETRRITSENERLKAIEDNKDLTDEERIQARITRERNEDRLKQVQADEAERIADLKRKPLEERVYVSEIDGQKVYYDPATERMIEVKDTLPLLERRMTELGYSKSEQAKVLNSWVQMQAQQKIPAEAWFAAAFSQDPNALQALIDQASGKTAPTPTPPNPEPEDDLNTINWRPE